MEALILDQQYDTIDIQDTFQSFIWTERYIGAGDFELYYPMSTHAAKTFQLKRYIALRDSDRYMIVEGLSVTTDPENGNYIAVSGRSLESILERRIVWDLTILRGSLQEGIIRLLNENIISPRDASRKIEGFTARRSSDPRVTNLTIDSQLHGENLYDAIFEICTQQQLGFRVLPNGNGGFLFELYFGQDRSYAQETLPWIVFSPDFENLPTSNYLESDKAYRNVALCAGEGEGSARKVVEVKLSEPDGLDRREIFVDAMGISTTTGSEPISDAEYYAQLAQKGLESLAECLDVKAFEGTVDATRQFIYGRDFKIGDIVQVRNEYGQEGTSRVAEVVRVHDVNGETLVPTFVGIL